MSSAGGTEAAASRLAPLFSSTPGLALAVLFGSTARGAPRPHSDLDVGVLFEHEPSADVWRQLEIALGRAAGRPVDLVDLHTAPPLLRFEIAGQAIVVHQGRPHAWTDFRARAMIDWWDWAPLARRIQAAAAQRLRAQVQHGPA